MVSRFTTNFWLTEVSVDQMLLVFFQSRLPVINGELHETVSDSSNKRTLVASDNIQTVFAWYDLEPSFLVHCHGRAARQKSLLRMTRFARKEDVPACIIIILHASDTFANVVFKRYGDIGRAWDYILPRDDTIGCQITAPFVLDMNVAPSS